MKIFVPFGGRCFINVQMSLRILTKKWSTAKVGHLADIIIYILM